MKLRFTLLASLWMLLAISLTGCKKELKDFTFSYSVECVENYKIVVQFNSDKTYRIERYNYYMDNFERKRDPKIENGTLSDEEFEDIKPLLQKANLLQMEDSYGFDKEPTSAESSLIYQLYLKTDDDEKYISIRNNETLKFSQSFLELISYTGDFLKSHQED